MLFSLEAFWACDRSFLFAFFDVGVELLSTAVSPVEVGWPAAVDCLNRVLALKPSSALVSEVNVTDFLRDSACLLETIR